MDYKQKFLKCKNCNNMVGVLQFSGEEIYCCNKPMEKLIVSSFDKLPKDNFLDIEIDNNRVNITSNVAQNTSTCWMYLQNENGGQRKVLDKNTNAINFVCEDSKPVSLFVYMGDEGLFKRDL